MRGLLAVLPLLLICCSLSHAMEEEERINCTEISRTDNYTYHLCNKTSRNFEKSAEICRKNVLDGELATLPSKADYDRLIAGLADEDEQTFRFFLGIRQRETNVDEFNPQTGMFFWVTQPESVITTASTDCYWQPLGKWIDDFDSLSLVNKHFSTLLMSSSGEVHPGYQFGQTQTADDVRTVCINQTEVIQQEQTTPAEQSGSDTVTAVCHQMISITFILLYFMW